MTEAMIPGPSPGLAYQPRARPRKPASRAPATPISMVTKNPPGSLPGIRNLAIAPTTNPMIKVHRIHIVPSKGGPKIYQRPGPDICERAHTTERGSIVAAADAG